MAILWEHHIIPQQCAGRQALEGIDLNAPENLIYLPQSIELARKMGVSPHGGGHLSSYYAICKFLDQMVGISDRSRRHAELRNLQDAMRLGLANGDLYSNNPRTGADTESINPKLIADYNGYLAARPDQVQELRDQERKGIDTGNPNLRKFSAILSKPEREKLLSEAIANNPGVNITPGNKDLNGTRWQSKFTAIDSIPDFSRTPGLAPASPEDFPPLPGSLLPSLDVLNQPEGFTRSDPLLSYGLPGLPAPDPDWQRRWQLPPSTAMPQDKQVLQFHPETGQPLRFLSDLSPVMGPAAAPVDRDAAFWTGMAVLGAGALLIPGVDIAAIGAALLAGATAAAVARPAFGADASRGAGADASVFSNGAAPYNPFLQAPLPTGRGVGSGDLPGSTFGPPIASRMPDQRATHASSFDDRFGNWTETPAGTAPAQAPRLLGAAPNAATGAVAPEDVRRLTRVNESNAGSVFASGASPVPYVLSPDLNDRFGNWSMPAGGQSSSASRPIGVFADEPSYVVPPTIWGVGDPAHPRNDASEWFSRWIQPLLRQE